VGAFEDIDTIGKELDAKILNTVGEVCAGG
jgi:hypothetical protein